MKPLVSVMIATRDRSSELRRTIGLLRSQDYRPLELIVIDDGSMVPIEPVVRESWPGARVIRHEDSVGQCESRNEGFAVSGGEFLLQLDDDCCLVRPGDLELAVQHLMQRPAAAAVVFDLYNGSDLPAHLPPSNAAAGCVQSFVGAAILFRTSALRQTAGYRSFYQAQGEEDEIAFQLLAHGWKILYCPWILAHHRVSPLNRNNLATWRRGLGNEIWTLILYMPSRRLPFEIGWKLLIGGWDAIRLGRPLTFVQGVRRCAFGLRRVWRLRNPFSPLALRRYDALRLRSVLTEAEFADPSPIQFRDLRGWWKHWRNRARSASWWMTSASDRGSSNIARYAHEYPAPRKQE